MPSFMRSACLVAATSCVRMICAPASTAASAQASDPGSRSLISFAPVNWPMKALREAPMSIGR